MFVACIVTGPIFEEGEIILFGEFREFCACGFGFIDGRIGEAEKLMPSCASEIGGEGFAFVIIFDCEKGDACICQREGDG